LPAATEGWAPYVPQRACDYHDRPGVLAFERLVLATYPSTGSYGTLVTCAAEGMTSEHSDGRAWDWKVTASGPEASALIGWLLADDGAMARRLGIMYIIRDGKIWGSYRPDDGWRNYPCSGDTGCHRNHVHFSFSWAGAEKRTSYWTRHVASDDYGPCRLPGRMFAPSYSGPRSSPCPAVSTLAPSDALVHRVQKASHTRLSSGSRGSAVKALQEALGGLDADGVYGAATTDRVTALQRRSGLADSGAVDAATWSALLSQLTGGKVSGSGAASGGSGTSGATRQPADPLASYVHTPLRKGSRGTAVKALQRRLHLAADGIFGPQTAGAVRRFQKAHHLGVDGVVGAQTWAALIAAGPAAPSGKTKPPKSDPPKSDPPTTKPPKHHPTSSGLERYSHTLLRQGSRGAAVKALQRRLHVAADGIFGPQTAGAVRRFQRAHHLGVDAIVGPQTWKALGA
jgi:peptidoglycan hydrolase-like protein with peptidoglycan-binding domain